MFSQIPQWLASWARMVQLLNEVTKNLIKHIMVAIGLNIPEACSAGHPSDFGPQEEDGSQRMPSRLHPKVRQHARAVQQVPAMQPDLQVEHHYRPMGSTSWITRTLFAFAAPSSTTISGVKAKSKPKTKPKVKPSSRPTSSTAMPLPYPEQNTQSPPQTDYTWTNIDLEHVTVEHLAPHLQQEVVNIIMMEDPRRDNPTNWMQEAFLNDPAFNMARNEMARRADHQRIERLTELGALIQAPGDVDLNSVTAEEEEEWTTSY